MSDRGCSVAGCDRKHRAKGLCDSHYRQLRRGQELRPLQIFDPSIRCAADECDRKIDAKGLCSTHYSQSRVYKDPCHFNGCTKFARKMGLCEGHYDQKRNGKDLVPLRHKVSIAEELSDRFWPFVDKNAENGCWVWTRHVRKDGYATLAYGGVKILVHRVAWVLLNGPIPDGMWLDHLCHNHCCCNPEHLRVVKPSVNAHNRIDLVGGSSGYRNVYKSKEGRWHARLWDDGVSVSLGAYDTPEEAHRVVVEYRKTNDLTGNSLEATWT